MIVPPVDDRLEPADRVLERHVLARGAGECLRDMERLREEALNLARPRDDQLVPARDLVHSQNGDDVAQLLVALQRLLDAPRDGVMLFAYHMRIELARGGVERVDRGIDTERGDVAGEHD